MNLLVGEQPSVTARGFRQSLECLSGSSQPVGPSVNEARNSEPRRFSELNVSPLPGGLAKSEGLRRWMGRRQFERSIFAVRTRMLEVGHMALAKDLDR